MSVLPIGFRGGLSGGGGGVPPTLVDHERAARVTAETRGFFRAVASTPRCRPGVIIGVLRAPVSRPRAPFSARLRLDPESAPAPALKQLWLGLHALIEEQSYDPQDWLTWTLEMRHALMHRSRLLDLLVARESEPLPLVLPQHVAQEVAFERLRADHHFRAKPWLPDMEHLADDQTAVGDAILREPSAVTIHGIAVNTQSLVEGISAYLLAKWRAIEAYVGSPVNEWRIEKPRRITFAGFAPSYELPTTSSMLISPRDEERVRLAAKLRDARRDGSGRNA